jgi:UDP-N-acetylglucosamine 2-epimerase (non-hydrolysing)
MDGRAVVAAPRGRQKILCVFGTRPEAIKMAPVIAALERRPDLFETVVCVTGQHREMLDQMLDLFRLRPRYDLDVMKRRQSLTGITVAVLGGLDPILAEERPDWVVVQGDTTTTLAAALAAFYAEVPVAHVEAGLRSGSLAEPRPEEMNRRATDAISDLLFAPTERAAENLLREGADPWRISVTGNTVVDAFNTVAELPFDVECSSLAGLPLDDKRLILVTVHRRENHGAAVQEICAGLRAIARHCDDSHFVVPVHLNPNVQSPVEAALGDLGNVTVVPPLDYPALVWLLSRCRFVITDSGGLQEEAVGIGKPVLVLRDRTERIEGVECGLAHLVGSDRGELAWWTAKLIYEPERPEAPRAQPYGDGRAAERIVERLAQGAPAPPDPAENLLEDLLPLAHAAV